MVELRDGDLVGRGEGAPNARYGEDRVRDMDLLADLAPEIADLEGPAGVEVFCEGLAAAGVPALRAGLSAAAWDLAGKQAGEPVWRMLGLARPSVRTSYTIAIGAPEDMLAQARAAAAFRTLKVKLGFDGDLDLARRLKLELPETTFRYDANEGWDRERAASALAVLEDLDAELVEQPLPAADAEGMAWLKERTRIPLLADEAVLTLDDLDAAGDAYDGVVVKLAKAGGIAGAFALISACTELRSARCSSAAWSSRVSASPRRCSSRALPTTSTWTARCCWRRTRSPGSVWRATCSPRPRSRAWECGRPADSARPSAGSARRGLRVAPRGGAEASPSAAYSAAPVRATVSNPPESRVITTSTARRSPVVTSAQSCAYRPAGESSPHLPA